jgi:hypothetical protein
LFVDGRSRVDVGLLPSPWSDGMPAVPDLLCNVNTMCKCHTTSVEVSQRCDPVLPVDGEAVRSATCRRGVYRFVLFRSLWHLFLCALLSPAFAQRSPLPSRATFRLTAGHLPSTSTPVSPPARGWQRRSYYLPFLAGAPRGSGSDLLCHPRSLPGRRPVRKACSLPNAPRSSSAGFRHEHIKATGGRAAGLRAARAGHRHHSLCHQLHCNSASPARSERRPSATCSQRHRTSPFA